MFVVTGQLPYWLLDISWTNQPEDSQLMDKLWAKTTEPIEMPFGGSRLV